MSNHEAFDVAYEYTVRFYPRYFTWAQFNINSDNSQRQTTGGQLREPADRTARDGAGVQGGRRHQR